MSVRRVPTDSPRLWQRVLLWLVVAALFTTWHVHRSMRDGRLRAGPTYDDVVYLVDALERLRVLDGGGVAAFARHWVERPPHSPWSTVLAMGAYGLAGARDWAPYAANGLVVLAMLLAVDHQMSGAQWLPRLAAAGVALAVSTTAYAVNQFRPDAAAGLATAVAMLLTVDDALRDSSRWRRIGIGVLWGLALLIKPTVFPQTLLLAAWAIVVRAWVVHWGRGASWRESLRPNAWVPIVLAATVVALPHYLINWAGVVEYIRDAVAGQGREVWRVDGGWGRQLGYYLGGESGRIMFGATLWPLVALTGLGAAAAWTRGGREDRATVAAGAALLAMAYAFPTLNPTKSPFLGQPMQFLLVLLAVIGLRGLVTPAPERVPAPAGAGGFIATACVVALLVLWALPSRNRQHVMGAPTGRDPAHAAAVGRVQRAVYEAVAPLVAGDDTVVYYTAPGFADGMNLRYQLLRDGRDADVRIAHFVTEPDAHRQAMSAADVVVAADAASGVVHGHLPSGRAADQTLRVVEMASTLDRVARVPGVGEGAVHVFVRRRE